MSRAPLFHSPVPSSQQGIDAWIRVNNIRILLITLLLSVMMIGFSRRSDVSGADVRETAFVIAALYGVMHVWSIRLLRSLMRDPRPVAFVVARMMRDPRRLTTLDLAAYWLLFAALAPSLMVTEARGL